MRANSILIAMRNYTVILIKVEMCAYLPPEEEEHQRRLMERPREPDTLRMALMGIPKPATLIYRLPLRQVIGKLYKS